MVVLPEDFGLNDGPFMAQNRMAYAPEVGLR